MENFKLHYREAFGGESPGLVDLIQKMPPPAALRGKMVRNYLSTFNFVDVFPSHLS